MAISAGFYKYLYNWIIDQQSVTPIYRPFETNVNPYKAKIFIVGAHPTPSLQLKTTEIEQYANALVDRNQYQLLYKEDVAKSSRDNKGAWHLANLFEREYAIPTVISYVNTLTAENLATLKKQRKENVNQFFRGLEIFKEVLEEFKPPIIILHGAYALLQFRTLLLDYFIELGANTRGLTELEGAGLFGKIHYLDGSETKVFVCKSLAFFKEENSDFTAFIEHVVKELEFVID